MSIISYELFHQELEKKIKYDDAMYYDLLKTVIKSPERYIGIFRISNVKNKLEQNLSQSREIKFGDFIENITTIYINAMGYKNLNKVLIDKEEQTILNVDQLFTKDNVMYLIEQKVRDDHDSTKKKGQYNNFERKCQVVRKLYPDKPLVAIMWFTDDSQRKNRKYYNEQAIIRTPSGVTTYILYGAELFNIIFKRGDVWDELTGYLKRNRMETKDNTINVPDFDTSPEILTSLKLLKIKDTKLFEKLYSDNEKYVQLRETLFPTGKNLNLAK